MGERRERTWWDGTREYERDFESMFASGTATCDICTQCDENNRTLVISEQTAVHSVHAT